MSDESTNNMPANIPSPTKPSQDSVSSPIIKQESTSLACPSVEVENSCFQVEPKVKEEDTLMTDAIIETSNEPIVKMEQVTAKEELIKDDTPVNPSVEVPAPSSAPPQQSLNNPTPTAVTTEATSTTTAAIENSPTTTTTAAASSATVVVANASTIADPIPNTNNQLQSSLSSPLQLQPMEATSSSTGATPVVAPVTTTVVASSPTTTNTTSAPPATTTIIQTADTVSPATSIAASASSTGATTEPVTATASPTIDTAAIPVVSTETAVTMATTTAVPAVTPTPVTTATTAVATAATATTSTPVESATTTTAAAAATSAAVPATPTPITTFEEIQKQLKNTLDHVEQRNMVSGFQTLSKATGAVVDHCEQLGLTSDDHPYNAIDREQFWAGLNNCWLYALAQRHEPSSDAERLTDQHLYSLREMVVSWADKLERFGLVDYEMGWWEADILAAIDGILAMNYAAAQAAAQAVVAQAAAALFGEEVNM